MLHPGWLMKVQPHTCLLAFGCLNLLIMPLPRAGDTFHLFGTKNNLLLLLYFLRNHIYVLNLALNDLLGLPNSREVILYSSFLDSSSQNTSKPLIFQNIWKRICEFFFISNFISDYHLGRILNKLWLKVTRFISPMSKSTSASIFIFVNF